MADARVVVIGDALIDEFRTAVSSEDFVGGAALNVAVGLSILGVPTSLVAMVGDDEDGDAIRAFLADFDVRLIASPSERGSARAISDRSEGEPRYRFNEASVNRWIDFDGRVLSALDAAPLVVVSCFRFDSDEQAAMLEAAVADSRSRLVIDPNPRAGMLHSAEHFVANFERIAASSLLAKVGDEDAALLYGSSLDDLAERLLAAGVPTVLSTAGGDGAAIRSTGGIAVREPIAVGDGPVVDTMGAGDATLSSVTAGLAQRRPSDAAGWQEILHEAMRVAAATCRSKGALLRRP